MSSGGAWRLGQYPPLSWVCTLARYGLDALAVRIASRIVVPPPAEPQVTVMEPVIVREPVVVKEPVIVRDEQAIELAQHILGQQAMLTYNSLNRLDRSLLLQGRVAAMHIASIDKIKDLGDVEFRVCSQWGEDGIIEWLCQRIPNIPRSFIEF